MVDKEVRLGGWKGKGKKILVDIPESKSLGVQRIERETPTEVKIKVGTVNRFRRQKETRRFLKVRVIVGWGVSIYLSHRLFALLLSRLS